MPGLEREQDLKQPGADAAPRFTGRWHGSVIAVERTPTVAFVHSMDSTVPPPTRPSHNHGWIYAHDAEAEVAATAV
jgi:hypothetical protein